MTTSITSGAKSASRGGKRGIFLDRNWRSAIERAARQQRQTPPGAPLWHFLTKAAAIAYTDDGELALELGDPPLVLLSSDAALLPELYFELEGLRYYSQLRRMNDRQRQHQARIYMAGAYLADALEQLADGLLASVATQSWDPHLSLRIRRGQVSAPTSMDTCRSTPVRVPTRPELTLPAIGRS